MQQTSKASISIGFNSCLNTYIVWEPAIIRLDQLDSVLGPVPGGLGRVRAKPDKSEIAERRSKWADIRLKNRPVQAKRSQGAARSGTARCHEITIHHVLHHVRLYKRPRGDEKDCARERSRARHVLIT